MMNKEAFNEDGWVDVVDPKLTEQNIHLRKPFTTFYGNPRYFYLGSVGFGYFILVDSEHSDMSVINEKPVTSPTGANYEVGRYLERTYHPI